VPSATEPSVIDFVNLIALFLAVWHTVRRLDAAKHQADHYPSVEAGHFQHWRVQALRAHGIVVWVCFGYIVLDLAFKAFVLPGLLHEHVVVVRAVGAGLFVSWAVGVAVGIHRVRDAERMRDSLGIEQSRTRDS
jgi:hypothetical protein